jgi:hypothetical protein
MRRPLTFRLRLLCLPVLIHHDFQKSTGKIQGIFIGKDAALFEPQREQWIHLG